MKIDDTIFGCATAYGKSAIAVFRISGKKSWDIVEKLAGDLPHKERHLEVKWLKTPSGDFLDQAMIVIFNENNSFTGEKLAELHIHGSLAVINSINSILSEIPRVRFAEAGEFTQRALKNDRLNLAEIEGLGDLLAAETEAQRRQSLRLLRGEMGKKVEKWREKLLKICALSEAIIDFPEEDIPQNIYNDIKILLDELLKNLTKEIEGIYWAERVRNGFEVAIVGLPNSGKSTLINAIAGRDIAIISETPGTTRDIIELHTEIKGMPITFIDTAGQRDAIDKIEKIGIKKAKERSENADLRIILTEKEDISEIFYEEGDLIYNSKADIKKESSFPKISGKTHEGIAEMLEKIGEIMSVRANSVGVAVNSRHHYVIKNAIKSLETAKNQLDKADYPIEIIAENLRNGMNALESLIGVIGIEQVLEQIFSKFCIGK